MRLPAILAPSLAIACAAAPLPIAASRTPASSSPSPSSSRSSSSPAPSVAASAPALASVADVAPASMTCLERWYAAKVDRDASGFTLVLPDGTHIFRADVEAIYEAPYPTGPIAPISADQLDPGAVRLDALMFATYGADAKAVWSSLVDVPFEGHVVKVHRRIEAPFRRVVERLRAAIRVDPSIAKHFAHLGGTFNWRPIAGTRDLSSHAWGIAIDLDPTFADYWHDAPGGAVKWRNRIPESIVRAFEAEGFIWGGRWYRYDTMHFEYRPELTAKECAIGSK